MICDEHKATGLNYGIAMEFIKNVEHIKLYIFYINKSKFQHLTKKITYLTQKMINL